MTAGCAIHAMIRMAPAHWEHPRGTTSYACAMIRAHARFASERDKCFGNCRVTARNVSVLRWDVDGSFTLSVFVPREKVPEIDFLPESHSKVRPIRIRPEKLPVDVFLGEGREAMFPGLYDVSFHSGSFQSP